MKKTFSFMRNLIVVTFFLFATMAQAQYVRTSYFMADEPLRMNINPALAPERGYFAIPFIVNGVSLSSNVFGTKYFAKVLNNSSNDSYFMSSSFLNKLEDRNYFNLQFDMNILNFGWWKRNAFWSVDMAIKTTADMRYPRQLFHFMKDMRSGNIDWKNVQYDLSGYDGTLSTYFETGVGYSRKIHDRLTFGVKGKVLLGIANLHAGLDKMDIDFDLSNVDADIDWANATRDELKRIRGHVDLDMHASISGYCKSMEFLHSRKHPEEVEDLEFTKFGFSGTGAAFDFGVDFKINERMNVSAAITDFGFIKWKAEANLEAIATASAHYNCPDDADELAQLLGSGETYNSEAFDRLTTYESGTAPSDSCSWLNSNIVAGFEFRPHEKISVGLLSSSHLARKSATELTLSGVFSPVKKINLALTYSMLQSRARSFGFGIGLGRILFIGTDYMWLKNDSKISNVVVGLTVPMGKKRADSQE